MLEVVIKIHSMLEGDMFYGKKTNLSKGGWEISRAWFAILNRVVIVCLLRDLFNYPPLHSVIFE